MNTHPAYFPELGFGLGLRIPHYQAIYKLQPDIDWFEIISENFMDTGGKARRNLDRIRANYPVVMHGIGLSIGSVDPLNMDYLRKLKQLATEIQPAWISDHLCWTGMAHLNTHDLLPVPYTEEALKHIVRRIEQVQDILQRPIALENPSTYLEYKSSEMTEAEFIARMVQSSGCSLLLDVNNVYVSCYNHRRNPKTYLDTLPIDKVVQIHLSGHRNCGSHIIDTHDDHVIDEVWALYRYTLQRAGHSINTMIEWDDQIPEWNLLYAELEKARQISRNASFTQAALPTIIDSASETAAWVEINSPPHKLLPTQALLQTAIITGGTDPTAHQQLIRPKSDFPADQQLSVYINAYRSRLIEVTAEDYPVLEHYLGADRFHSLLEDFVSNTRSSHFNIACYCHQLPDFVASQFGNDSFAFELAQLENALSELHDAEETEPLEPADLAGIDADVLMHCQLWPRKALQLFKFRHAVNHYFQSVQDEAEPQEVITEPGFLAVFRHEDLVWRMDLDADEYGLLQRLFSGESIAVALAASSQQTEAQVSNWFARWMRNGLLRKFQSQPPPITNTQGDTHEYANQ
jgi:hypothetical protein